MTDFKDDDDGARDERRARFDRPWHPTALNDDSEGDGTDPSARVAAFTWAESELVRVPAAPKACPSCSALIDPGSFACRC